MKIFLLYPLKENFNNFNIRIHYIIGTYIKYILFKYIFILYLFKFLKIVYTYLIESSAPILRMAVPDSKVTSLIWGTLDHTIITGHEDGAITQWDLRVC